MADASDLDSVITCWQNSPTVLAKVGDSHGCTFKTFALTNTLQTADLDPTSQGLLLTVVVLRETYVYRRSSALMISELFTTWQKHRGFCCMMVMAFAIAFLIATPASAQRVRLGDSFVIPGAQVAPQLIPNTGPPIRPNVFPTQINPAQVNPIQLNPGQVTIPPGTLPPTINTQPVLPTLQSPFPAAGTVFPQPQIPVLPPTQFPGVPPSVPPGGFPPATFPGAAPAPGGFGSVPSGVFPGSGIVPGATQPIQPPPFIYPPPATGSVFPPGGNFNLPQSFPGQLPQVGVPGLNNGFGFNPNGINGSFGNNGFGLSPNGSNGSWGNSALAWPSQAWARLRGSNIYRFLERPRWRHTYLSPDAFSGSRGLGLNETDIATTFSVPNFLYTSQPVRISPGFAFHFWEGPDTATTGADLPGQTFSTYLANDFSTPWNRQLGAELNLTIGLYTDFQEVTSDSIRITGVGLGWFRLNNTTTFKAGIEYLDRVRVKLLPAIGFFIYPTPDLKLDVYFPRPKIAQRLPNLGNYEVWGYLGGEYGGGSWTIERINGVGDQVDVNDIRAFIGLEWLGPRQVTGFLEGGYVFDREIVYRSAPHAEIDIDDTFMLRAGLAF